MLDKLIKKRLDMYYSNKLIKEIQESVKCVWDLDIIKEKREKEYVLYVKKRKYKDSEYKAIIHFRYDDSLIHLIRLDKTLNKVNEILREYDEKE